MSYREFEELRDALELTRAPDYSTLNRMYHRFQASHLNKMNEALLKQAGLVKRSSQWTRLGFARRTPSPTLKREVASHLDKGVYAVGASSQMIVHGVRPSNASVDAVQVAPMSGVSQPG